MHLSVSPPDAASSAPSTVSCLTVSRIPRVCSSESLCNLRDSGLQPIEHYETAIRSVPAHHAFPRGQHLADCIVFQLPKCLFEKSRIISPPKEDAKTIPLRFPARDFLRSEGYFLPNADTVYLLTCLVNTPKNRNRVAKHIEKMSAQVLREVEKDYSEATPKERLAIAVGKVQLEVYWKILKIDRISEIRNGFVTDETRQSRYGLLTEVLLEEPQKFRDPHIALSLLEWKNCPKLVDLERKEFHAMLRLRYLLAKKPDQELAAAVQLAKEQILDLQKENFCAISSFYRLETASTPLAPPQ